jgi:hypothetical protein
MRTFRWSLALGTGVVLGLAILRLFPLALVSAAVLIPLVTVIYLYDVDVYEDEPLLVLVLTILYGAMAGAAIALIGRAWSPLDVGVAAGPGHSTTAIRGVIIPSAGLLIALIGPLVLLPYRRFNDVLDGVTFGVASAVCYVGALVLISSLRLLGEGLRPVGLVSPWLARLLTFGIAVPLLTAAVAGATTGALWLRFRAQVADRKKLGVLGNPLLSLILAAAAVIAGALAQLKLDPFPALAVLIGLDALALLWLRQLIHLGLLEEGAEIVVGPPITCVNCGHSTPRHSFCSNCGIALQALPKSPRSAPRTQGQPATGPT